MATYASRPAWEVRARALPRLRAATPVALGLLLALALLLRLRELGIGLWIDEGLSLGIADRPLADIPGVLHQDGSPPLYYVLLHGWIRLAGTSEIGVRSLSLLFAVLAVPAAWWAGRVVLGARAGWIAAVLAATNPFLTQYAQEARMYSLVALLGLAACACLARALAGDASREARRPWAIGAAVALAAMLYTHNWALFFAAAWGGTWLVLLCRAGGQERRTVLESGLVAFGGALALWLPWVPTVAYQAAHTGAPWSQTPSVAALLWAPGQLLGTMAQAVLALVGGAGVAAMLARGRAVRARTALALLAVGALTVLLAWLASWVAPAWATRYLAVGLAPFLLAAAGGLAHAGRLGIAGALLVAIMGIGNDAPAEKSNVRDVAEAVAPSLRPGDLVVSTQPEQVAVLHHYLPRGLRWATLTGRVPDVGITDWRDGTARLRAATPAKDLDPLVAALPDGARLVLVTPVFADLRQWRAPWTKAVRTHSYAWEQHLSNDPRLHALAVDPPPPVLEPGPVPVQATTYVKSRR